MLRVNPSNKLTPEALHRDLIAPCGMNCGLCRRYLRERDRCEGCASGDADKSPSVRDCPIRNCEALSSSESGFCFECDDFPCARLKRLDKRYRTKYRMSMLENQEAIRESGLEAFVESERKRWGCPDCSGIQCVHTPACVYCGHEWE